MHATFLLKFKSNNCLSKKTADQSFVCGHHFLLMQEQELHEAVQEYYGETLHSTTDLKYSACCIPRSDRHRMLLRYVSPKVLSTFYGCGTPIPDPLEGLTVVDLGSGSGRDCFIISALVGQQGHVIGVDMTPEQIAIANEAISYHKEKLPNASPIEFRKGFIEDLHTANIEDESVDVVISNCVINLSSDKKSVFREIFRVLKQGGEVHISDVFASKPLPSKAHEDKVLVGECIGNVLDLNGFVEIIKETGFNDLRVVEARIIETPEFPADLITPGTVFYSITFSCFKGVPVSTGKGVFASYKGGIEEAETSFQFDINHKFKKDTPLAVSDEIAFILKTPRYAKYFEFGEVTDVAPVPTFLENIAEIKPNAKPQQGSSSGSCCCCSGGCCGGK